MNFYRPAIALAGFLLPLALIVNAWGQEHKHPPEHAQIHDEFYRHWMRPDNPNVSCCNQMDCAPAEARIVGGMWRARKIGTEKWFTVPTEKIEQFRDSPDGRNHLCAMGETVYCFITGGGT